MTHIISEAKSEVILFQTQDLGKEMVIICIGCHAKSRTPACFSV